MKVRPKMDKVEKKAIREQKEHDFLSGRKKERVAAVVSLSRARRESEADTHAESQREAEKTQTRQQGEREWRRLRIRK